MSVYVVILNWNACRDTLACIDSLRQSSTPQARLVICDNGSTDGSVASLSQALQARFGNAFCQIDRAAADGAVAAPGNAQVWLIANQANLGFAAGNNIGIRFALRDAACSHVWVLNNDTEVALDALAQALARMQADPSIGICGSTLVYHHDRRTVQALGGASYSRWTGRTRHLGAFGQLGDAPVDSEAVERATACVVGAAMLVSRAFLAAVGLMREDYFLFYEEMDWSTRAGLPNPAGQRFRLGYAPRSVVFHKEGASIGTAASGGSALSLFYLFRNRLRFSWRYHRLQTPVVLACALLDVAKLLLRRRWPQALAALRGLLQQAAPVPVLGPARSGPVG